MSEVNEKAEVFEEWCKVNREYSLPITIAQEAIKELKEKIADVQSSLFGDGWYSGFLKAKGLEQEGELLDEFSDDDILKMSEHAESDCLKGIRKPWSKNVPTKQGFYWHWTGDEDDAPCVLSVLTSGSKKENNCFVSSGQLGLVNAVFCNEYGGYWASCIAPETPDLSEAEK